MLTWPTVKLIPVLLFCLVVVFSLLLDFWQYLGRVTGAKLWVIMWFYVYIFCFCFLLQSFLQWCICWHMYV